MKYIIIHSMKPRQDISRENLEKKLLFFKDACRRKRLNITPQRLEIYKALASSKEHPSATAVYQKLKKVFPNMSFDTVNRNLLMFDKIGIVNVVCPGEAKRFDADTSEHHHLRCIRCRDIVDVYSKYFDNIKVPVEIKKQFTVLKKNLMLEGICARCKKS